MHYLLSNEERGIALRCKPGIIDSGKDSPLGSVSKATGHSFVLKGFAIAHYRMREAAPVDRRQRRG